MASDLTNYTATDIAAAKDSPLYNPSMDSTDIGIYNLMSAQGTPQSIVDEYSRAFMSMTTNNIYSGVVNNPNQCEIADANNGITGTNSDLNNYYNNGSTIDDVSDPTGNTSVPNSSVDIWKNEMDPTNTSGLYYIINNDPYGTGTGFPDPTDTSLTGDEILGDPSNASISSGLNAFENHTNRLISNLPSILGMVQTALGLASALANLLNPCLGTGDFLNSLMSEGKAMITKIEGYISQLAKKIKNWFEDGLGNLLDIKMSSLNGIFSDIKDFANEVKSYVQSAVAWIQKEMKKLINALIDSIKTGLSGFLKGLKSDPCIKALLGGVTNGAALSLL